MRKLDVRVLKVVVASPSDVQDERGLVKKVAEELNGGIAADRGLRLEVARWETDTYPGFHPEGPQGWIESMLQIKDCHILIGIFGRRFGSPTKNARSGTQQELRTAYEAWKKKGAPHIMVYFKHKAYAPQSAEESEQWTQVFKFKDDFPEQGLWWSYYKKTGFEKLLRRHLTLHLRRQYPLAVWHLRNDIEPDVWRGYYKAAKRRIWLLGHCMLRAVDPGSECTGEILADRLGFGVDVRLVILNPDEQDGQLQEIADRHEPTILKERIEKTRDLALLMKKNALEKWEQPRNEDGENATNHQKPRMSIRYTPHIIHSSIVIIDDHYLVTPYSHLNETGDNGLVADIYDNSPHNKSICANLKKDFLWHYDNAREI